MSGPIVLLYKGGEHATGAPDCFTFCRDRTRGLRRPGFGTAWHVSELGEGCNTSLCRAMYRKVIPSVCQMFARVYANPVLSKNPIDAVRRADSTLDARRVATFVTAESRCSACPVCRLFPKCCSSSSWPSRAGSTRSRVTSLTLSRKRIASAESSSVLAGSGSPTPSAGAWPHRPRASGDGYAVTGTPWSRPRPSSAGIDS